MPDFVRMNDRIILGRQPTLAELKRWREAGVQTVIDFRHPSETAEPNAALAAAAGLGYVNIPLRADTIGPADVAALDHALRDQAGPFLLHCAVGPRAAGLYFLRGGRRNGWTAERTLAESARAGFDLAGMPWLASFICNQLRDHTAPVRRRA